MTSVRRARLGSLLRAGVLTIGAGLLGSPSAHACSCGPTPTVAEDLKLSDAVFTAEVVKLEVLPSWWQEEKADPELLEEIPTEQPTRVMKATFAVMKSWKGADQAVAVVRTFVECCVCGTSFEIGQRYLVYAYRGQQSGKLWTNICSRTRTFETAAEDLAALGAPAVDFEARRRDKAAGRKAGAH